MWGNQGGFSGYGQGGGGGGFMSSPGFSSQAGPVDDRVVKRSRSASLIPCTVADVLTAENADGAYRICGGRTEAGQISLIGLVKAVRELPTRVEYELDDSTGPVLDIRQFVEPAEDGSSTSEKPFPENTFIKVFGHIREINGKRMMAAFNVKPVNDMNMLTEHLLQIVRTRLYWIKGQDEQNMNTAVKNENRAGGAHNQMSGGGFYAGFTRQQTMVHKLIHSNTTEQGASIQQLQEQCQDLSLKQIRDAIEFLSGEGHIYSTIDDDHYRTTDS